MELPQSSDPVSAPDGAAFTTRLLAREESVGTVLQNRRAERDLSLTDVEARTGIRSAYIDALERQDFSALPAEVYVQGYLRKYAQLLGLSPEKILTLYRRERQVESGLVTAKKRRGNPPKPLQVPRVVITPKTLSLAVVALLALLLVWYIVSQLISFVGAPTLKLTQPAADDLVLEHEDAVTIAGTADPGANVFINEFQIRTEEDGRFSEQVVLSDGVNIIEIRAVNKLQKETTVTKHILAKIDKPQPPAAASAVTGVEATVRTDAFAWVQVMVDGTSAFEGNFAAEASRTFKGEKTIRIRTGKAGHTFLLVRTEKTAKKELGPLGGSGDVVELEFSRDQTW